VSVPSGDRDEIRIGVTWSDQGWCWLDSRFIYPGLQVWVAETNAAGGMFVPDIGRRLPVRLIQYDDASDPEVAVDAVRRLIHEDHVDVLVSSGSSEIHAEVIGLSEAAGIVHLNVAAPDPALFPGTRFHLQCGPHLHGAYSSRVPFWRRHGLERVAFLYADFAGWNAVGVGLREQLAEAGLTEALWQGVPRHERWSTQYGPFPRDFDGWSDVVTALADARPDVVVVALPAPAEYRLMREIRARRLWFPYLEMMYGPFLGKIGFGPEDLLHLFHGRRTPGDPTTVTVGGTLEDLAAKAARFLPGVAATFPRSYVGPAVWEHLVQGAGSIDGEAVMARAHATSGDIVTVEGRLTWNADGDVESGGGSTGGGEVMQLQRHPWSADVVSVRVWPEDGDHVAPVLSRAPYEHRPPPWTGRW
jgi:hypothetical protein